MLALLGACRRHHEGTGGKGHRLRVMTGIADTGQTEDLTYMSAGIPGLLDQHGTAGVLQSEDPGGGIKDDRRPVTQDKGQGS